ncbi:unnamed protein product [Gordionus sp. m RMFG-2023]
MIIGSNLTKDDMLPFKKYKHILPLIIYNPPQPSCYMGKCINCPGSTHLRDQIEILFRSKDIEFITYKQWLSVDITTLETITKP